MVPPATLRRLMSLEAVTAFLESSPRTAPYPPPIDGIYRDYHLTLRAPDLLEIFRTMYMSRALDDRELILQKQMQAWFTIFCAGKEAVLAAAGKVLRRTDPIWGYYRDRAIVLQRGVTAREMLMQAVAAKDDPASSGRQMPDHFGHPTLGVITQASPTGSQCIPAVGLAEAIAKTKKLIGTGRYPGDAIVYLSIGDASTAEGEFYEGLRAAILSSAPVIVHVMDDGFGISVPASEQVPGEDVTRLFRDWPALRFIDVDGTDVRASYDAFTEAAGHCRARRGPVLLRSRVLRLYSHSSTDDMKKYRPKRDIACDFERDPIVKFARELVEFGIVTADELLAASRAIDEEVRAASESVTPLPKTDARDILDGLYNYQPAEAKKRWRAATDGKRCAREGEKLYIADALNAGLDEILSLDPRIVMWGEDIADLSRENLERHGDLDGKGGVFGITKGLQRAHGPDRVSNAPIAEATIVGRAVGWSVQGFLPIVEIQFRDYLNPAWQQLVDQAATLSWRSGGRYTCPMVIRMSYGGYLGGAGAIWHSESANGPLLHHPGIFVCVPSNPRDAVGLLRAAAFCNDIVCYNEPKALYRRPAEFVDMGYPGFDVVAWPGTACTYGEGKDLAVITYGNTAHHCWAALKALEREGIRGRMVDLRWLNPLDEEAIRSAADDCGLVLIVDEDRRTCGAGSAVADVIYRDRELRRRVDVERVASLDCRVAYGPGGEKAVIPQVEDVLRAARDLVKAAKRD